MNRNNNQIKELVFYLSILVILIVFIICNNLFWNIGKQHSLQDNNIYFESSNVIYNVPYEEEWLD